MISPAYAAPYEIFFGDGEPITDASRTLFVGDLSYFCKDEHLIELFAPYGPVIKAHVRRGATGDSLMHGFVAVESPDRAQLAIERLNGFEFMGRNIRVQLSSDTSRPNPNAKDVFVQVHVSFISRQTQMIITEKVLRDIFSPYGAIADVTVKKHTLTMHRQSGYGFVYFVEANAAYQALHSLKQTTIYEITFDCSISHKSEDQLQYAKTPHFPGYFRSNSGNSAASSPRNFIYPPSSPSMDPRALYQSQNRSNSGGSNIIVTDSMNMNGLRERGWSGSSNDPYDPVLHSPATTTTPSTIASPAMSMGGLSGPMVRVNSINKLAMNSPHDTNMMNSPSYIPAAYYNNTPPLSYAAGPGPNGVPMGYPMNNTMNPMGSGANTPVGMNPNAQRLRVNTLHRMRAMEPTGSLAPRSPHAHQSNNLGGNNMNTGNNGLPTNGSYYQSPPLPPSSNNAFPLAAPPLSSKRTFAPPPPGNASLGGPGVSSPTLMNNTHPPLVMSMSPGSASAGLVGGGGATKLEEMLSTLRVDTSGGSQGPGNNNGLPMGNNTPGNGSYTYFARSSPGSSLHSSPTYRQSYAACSSNTNNMMSTQLNLLNNNNSSSSTLGTTSWWESNNASGSGGAGVLGGNGGSNGSSGSTPIGYVEYDHSFDVANASPPNQYGSSSGGSTSTNNSMNMNMLLSSVRSPRHLLDTHNITNNTAGLPPFHNLTINTNGTNNNMTSPYNNSNNYYYGGNGNGNGNGMGEMSLPYSTGSHPSSTTSSKPSTPSHRQQQVPAVASPADSSSSASSSVVLTSLIIEPPVASEQDDQPHHHHNNNNNNGYDDHTRHHNPIAIAQQ